MPLQDEKSLKYVYMHMLFLADNSLLHPLSGLWLCLKLLAIFSHTTVRSFQINHLMLQKPAVLIGRLVDMLS